MTSGVMQQESPTGPVRDFWEVVLLVAARNAIAAISDAAAAG